MAYGVSVAWGAIALPVLQSENTPLYSGPITSADTSWLSSCLCLLALLSTPILCALSNRIGRKALGYIVAGLHLVSWFLLCTTEHHSFLYLARATFGVAAGATLVFVPLYVSEVAEDSIRGALGCLLICCINIGVLFGYVLGSYVPYHTANMVYTALPVIFAALFFFLPETPTYLLAKNRPGDAVRALKTLRGGRHAAVSEELSQMTASVQQTQAEGAKVPLLSLLRSRGSLRAILITVVLNSNQQLSGIFALLFFTVFIFQESGSDVSPNVACIIVGVLQLIGTVLSCILVERCGRRVLLLISNITVVVDLAVLGLYFYCKAAGFDVSAFSWLPLLCLSVYMVVFSLGLGPVPFVIMAEVFHPQVRSVSTAMGLCTVWGLAFIVVVFFGPLSELLGLHGCYWLFAASSLLGTVFVALFVPETRGLSLDVILKHLESGPWRGPPA